MIKWIKEVLNGYDELTDSVTGERYNLLDVVEKLTEVVDSLEQRVQKLEEENIQTTNELYRLENSLDSRIDILAENSWKKQFDV